MAALDVPGCAWQWVVKFLLPLRNKYLNHTICRTGANIKMSSEYQTNIQMAEGGVQMCLDMDVSK